MRPSQRQSIGWNPNILSHLARGKMQQRLWVLDGFFEQSTQGVSARFIIVCASFVDQDFEISMTALTACCETILVMRCYWDGSS